MATSRRPGHPRNRSLRISPRTVVPQPPQPDARFPGAGSRFGPVSSGPRTSGVSRAVATAARSGPGCQAPAPSASGGLSSGGAFQRGGGPAPYPLRRQLLIRRPLEAIRPAARLIGSLKARPGQVAMPGRSSSLPVGQGGVRGLAARPGLLVICPPKRISGCAEHPTAWATIATRCRGSRSRPRPTGPQGASLASVTAGTRRVQAATAGPALARARFPAG